jgi:chemotaxis protein methyltransferase CheR
MRTAVRQAIAVRDSAPSADSLTSAEFAAMAELIGQVAGIRLPPAKKLMLEARLRRRLRALGMDSYGTYCAFVLGKGRHTDEIIHLIDVVTTNKTDFFREPHHFQHLVQHALPTLMREQQIGVQGRYAMVWSAGCSSGEEPYTLAMILAEFAHANRGFASFVLGTDISTEVLERAKRAIYTEEQIAPVPTPLRARYFLRSKDRSQGLVRVIPALRQQVGFRRLNFLEGDFHLREPIDILFCRNVLIYFDRPTQEMVLNRFAGHMGSGGFLYLGHSESINGLDVPLVQVAPTVYRKSSRHRGRP